MEVKEIECGSIMSKSGLKDSKYSINPYRGCSHSCVYCYAPYILREKRKWGEFVDVKINASHVLEKELRKNKEGTILISSVTDPYQAMESKYKATRKILEKLIGKDFVVSVLTKSNEFLKDLDLFKKLNCEVGVTITTLDDEYARKFEPGAPSPSRRLEALNYFRISGIKTYIFFGPMLPFISDINLERTIKRFASAKPEKIYVDKLNVKGAHHWNKIKTFLEKNYPDLVGKWEEVIFKKSDYYDKLKERLKEFHETLGLNFEFCY